MSTTQHPYWAPPEAALNMFAHAPSVHFAGADAQGSPLARTFTAVMVDGAICFHCGNKGEKLGLIDQRVIAFAEDIVAQVPSYWVHPSMACPASTYYLSAQAEGVVREVHDLERKARMLSVLMERFQPEGGYTPIVAHDSKYTGIIKTLVVCELVPERVSARHKLGQKRSGREITRVLEGLWARGGRGDLRAIRLIKESHPERPEPAFLQGIADTSLCVWPSEDDAREVAALLDGQYWTTGISREALANVQLASSAWIVLRERSTQRVLGSARAITDRGRMAWVLDVIVHPDFRGRGAGKLLMTRLLEHPALKHVRRVGLATRDAHTLYEGFGFARTERTDRIMELTRV
jgi:N-acetylglutamate synthase-like GNAT family acetyltransferase/nitroimidazol reductase NimA-like FMN-containing flavoprotein (pyridoxamine 5'-phosphate oxidase superfamily)